MGLSSELISKFVKATKDETSVKPDTIAYGTVQLTNGELSLQLDGSNTSIPIADSTIDRDKGLMPGNRVMVLIKNHKAVIIGNLTSQSITVEGIQFDLGKIDKIELDNIKINDELEAQKATITEISTDYGEFKGITADKLEVAEAKLGTLDTDYLKTEQLEAKYATIDGVKATNGDIYNLKAIYASAERMAAAEATIGELGVTYANIDFSNIGQAAMEYLYSTSGLIDNVIIGDGTITGNLVGVTIKGDLIESDTLIADKLVIKGEDGLYYKLNTDGVTTSAEQTEYNSLNGSVITAKSITATQISVDDLVAFDATIGGFTITEDAIYSEVKDSEGNTTRGVHLGSDGQVNFGDETNFIKYYRDDDGSYKLAISAASIMYALNGKQYSIADLGTIGEYVHIGAYEGEPCIELGEGDSDFKLIITNTRIMFVEGTSVPAYINNQSLHIKKAVIEEELQQGSFVWKVRANGNMGLVWKGGV